METNSPLSQTDITTLLEIFATVFERVELMELASEENSGQYADLSEDDNHQVISVRKKKNPSVSFDLVIYRRNDMIGIETELDVGPALVEGYVVSIWNDLPQKVNMEELFNRALEQTGIEKYAEMKVSNFDTIYQYEMKR